MDFFLTFTFTSNQVNAHRSTGTGSSIAGLRAAKEPTNLLHEKTLRIVYSNFKTKLDELLEIDGYFSTHHRNIQNFERTIATNNE